MLTYSYCEDLLAKRETKKLSNNTYLRKDENVFVVKFHDTDVIKVFVDGNYELNTSGFQSVTTKARLNEFSPVNISQKSGIWYINYSGKSIPFYDGIVIDSNGVPVSAIDLTTEIQAKKKFVDKMVKEYINGYCKKTIEDGFMEPGPGDCWLCLMGLGGNSVDHIWSHVEEKYYFGSFLKTAIRARNYNNPQIIMQMIKMDVGVGRIDTLKDILTSYFRKIKPQLLEYVEISGKIAA